MSPLYSEEFDHRFQIGRRRPDGKYNVWTLIEHVANHPQWTIVAVKPNWSFAKQWIDRAEAAIAKERAW